MRLEIGFGGGEHLLHAARREPATGFIGVEPFVNGMAKLMLQPRRSAARQRAGLRRRRDPRCSTGCRPARSTTIDLLYPDPWPKKRHWKRRFVSAANLDRFARVLRPGGVFRFASDIDTYVNWTLLHCRAHGAFEWRRRHPPTTGASPIRSWPGTRYEAKALREGRSRPI